MAEPQQHPTQVFISTAVLHRRATRGGGKGRVLGKPSPSPTHGSPQCRELLRSRGTGAQHGIPGRRETWGRQAEASFLLGFQGAAQGREHQPSAWLGLETEARARGPKGSLHHGKSTREQKAAQNAKSAGGFRAGVQGAKGRGPPDT